MIIRLKLLIIVLLFTSSVSLSSHAFGTDLTVFPTKTKIQGTRAPSLGYATAYYLQIATFSNKSNAQAFSQRITQLTQHLATIKPLQQQANTFYVVQLESLSKQSAISLAQNLKQQGINAEVKLHNEHTDASQTFAENHHQLNSSIIDTSSPATVKTSQPIFAQANTSTDSDDNDNSPSATVDSPPPTGIVSPEEAVVRQHNDDIKPGKSRLWNLRNADIRSVIAEVSRETGINFLLDPRVQGKITIIANTPMTPREVYPVFLAALQISGYAAIPDDHITKIVPNIESNGFNGALVNGRKASHGNETVVQVIPVKYVSAQQLVPILRPLMPQWSQISAYNPSNMLIVSGTANNLSRIAEIVNSVDIASYDDMNMIRLRNATAQDVVKTIRALQGTQQSAGGPAYSVAADERSNSIIISGNKEMRLRLRVLISELDTSSVTEGIERDTQIIALHYMQAKDLLPILAGVAKSHYPGPVETIMGTRTLTNLESGDTGISSGPSMLGSTSSVGTAPMPMGPPEETMSVTTTKAVASEQPIIEIIGEPNTNSIILNAPAHIMQILKRIIAKIDVRPVQVSIEAMIAELTQDDINRLGIRWGSQDNPDGKLTRKNFQAGFGIITANQVSDFEIQIEALANNNQTDVLSTPSVVVMDNHLAHIKVGREVSVATTSYPNNASGTAAGSPFTTFDRKDAALALKVTPQVSDDGTIKLNLISENNTVAPLEDTDNPQSPPFNISEISTSVIVNDGDILVFGGLTQNELRNFDESIPIVGDIPIIGRLFHRTVRNNTKKKLMIFLHPVILHNSKESYDFSVFKYNLQRRAQLKSLLVYPYNDEIHENVLPAYNQVVLPEPFTAGKVIVKNKTIPFGHYNK